MSNSIGIGKPNMSSSIAQGNIIKINWYFCNIKSCKKSKSHKDIFINIFFNPQGLPKLRTLETNPLPNFLPINIGSKLSSK